MVKSISHISEGAIIHNNDWLIKKTDEGFHAFRKDQLLSGAIGSVTYSISLSAFFAEGPSISYYLSVRFRAGEPEQLPTDIILKITDKNGSRELPCCSSGQIYSIIHNDYVSSLSVSIDEADIVSLYRKGSYLEIVHQGEQHNLKLDRDDTISLIKLKKRLVPGALSKEQKEVLIEEQRKEKEERERQEEEKRKREEEKRKREEEKKKYEIEKKLKEEQLRIQAEEKRIEEYVERRLAIEKEFQEEQLRILAEEKKRKQQLEIRDIELRPDAKVLAKVTFDRYWYNLKRNQLKDQCYISPSAGEEYLPQFMDREYLNEVEALLSKRHILILDKYSFDLRLNGQLFDSASLSQLYDIIDMKTTAKDVIKGVPDLSSSSPNNKIEGCYIATCVYGSYDCPEVWTLRRYRDQVLRRSILGRGFIKVYYAISPKLVARFGQRASFQKINRRVLDNWVRTLKYKGFENTPYTDK